MWGGPLMQTSGLDLLKQEVSDTLSKALKAMRRDNKRSRSKHQTEEIATNKHLYNSPVQK